MKRINGHGLKSLAGPLAMGLLASAAHADSVGGLYADHHGMMGGGYWLYGPIMMLLFFGLLVGAVVVMVRLLGSGGLTSNTTQEDRAQMILRERFAKGEITEEQFEAARKVLDGHVS